MPLFAFLAGSSDTLGSSFVETKFIKTGHPARLSLSASQHMLHTIVYDFIINKRSVQFRQLASVIGNNVTLLY